MGYEIVFKYKESGETPGLYKDEILEKTQKVGKITEEVGIDVIAGKIMSQLARRNILIVDVEIYEYAKKKLSYRETSDGIVIKNKKFSFDSGSVVVTDEFEEDFKPIPSPSKELADKSCPLAAKMHVQPQFKRAIRHEIFEPEPLALHKAQQKGLKFTVGKKYPIYSETSLGTTIIYKTTDDRGKDVEVSSEYFMAVGAGLIEQDEGPKYVGAENVKQEINLWGNYESVDMPDIRRR
jgi:hypothetical protein